jgi:hypothetical protein
LFVDEIDSLLKYHHLDTLTSAQLLLSTPFLSKDFVISNKKEKERSTLKRELNGEKGKAG